MRPENRLAGLIRHSRYFKSISKLEFLRSLLIKDRRGAALLEFAIALPLLVVFVVGIYDFSGAFNQKQKVEQAAQEGAILAAAQPMNDIAVSNVNPDSLQPIVAAVFNSLLASGVLPNGTPCAAPGTVAGPTAGLTWTYTISGCPDNLVIAINRGWMCASPCTATPPLAVSTIVTVTYPYHWRFNSVIQLLFPGSNSYAATTLVTESASVHNQT
jgi:Flp pilus assembly protein TadG